METNKKSKMPNWVTPKVLWSLIGVLMFVVVVGCIAWYQIIKETPVISSVNQGWKTYLDSQHGFSFQYPSNLELQTTNEVDQFGHTAIYSSQIKSSDNSYITMSYVSDPNTLSVDEYIKKYFSNSSGTYKKVTVLGKEALQEELRTGNSYSIHTEIFVSSNIFNVAYYQHDQLTPNQTTLDLYNQILSTFKFTNSSGAADNSTWKTYSNSQYGFSLQYPSSWQESSHSALGNDYVYAKAYLNSPENLANAKKVIAANMGSEGYADDVELSVYPVTQIGSLDKYLSTNQDVVSESVKKTTLGGLTAYELTIGGFGSSYKVMIEKKGLIYELRFGTTSDKSKLSATSLQILASFKFTK